MRLLIAEDDMLLGEGLRAALGKAGFTVTWVRDGRATLGALDSDDFVALVLDIGLPGMNGLEVLKTLRRNEKSLPVLMLTASDTTRDKVTSLDGGADDYLVKTVDMEELIARLRALIRRSGLSGNNSLRVGELLIDIASHSVKKSGLEIKLSPREFGILRVLMEGPGRIYTKAQLEKAMYGWETHVDSNTIEVHIHHLRAKLGADTIHTVRGVGYTIRKPSQ